MPRIDLAGLKGRIVQHKLLRKMRFPRDGIRGSDGEDGGVGSKGDKGDKGDQGMSAFEVAVFNGFSGEEEDWLESLKGADGLDGAKGDKGDTGATGATGSTGAKGDKGDKGDTGDTGPQGPQGPSKRIVVASATTDSSGNASFTFSPAFTSTPFVVAAIVTTSTRQFVRLTALSTTGCSVNAYQQNTSALSLLGLDIITAGVTNINGATVRILAVES